MPTFDDWSAKVFRPNASICAQWISSVSLLRFIGHPSDAGNNVSKVRNTFVSFVFADDQGRSQFDDRRPRTRLA